MTALLALWLALHQPPLSEALERGIVRVESRGDRWAVSPVGARGLWQVRPRWALVPAWALHLPGIGEWEGRRVWRRWARRCGGDVTCALRAYACGSAGLRGRCGAGYAAVVLAAGGGR